VHSPATASLPAGPTRDGAPQDCWGRRAGQPTLRPVAVPWSGAGFLEPGYQQHPRGPWCRRAAATARSQVAGCQCWAWSPPCSASGPKTISKRIRDIRQLLDQAGYTIQPGPHRLASLDDLSRLAAAEGITTPPEIKTAC